MFREKVRVLMEQKGMTQKNLSRLSGITEASISRYLNGDRNPRIDIVINFAKALNVSPQYLIEDDQLSLKEKGFIELKSVIARNASQLTAEEKNELIALLIGRK